MANINSQGKTIGAIVAMDMDGIIGISDLNIMPWQHEDYANDDFIQNVFRPQDMQLFRKYTRGSHVIVGAHTADSMKKYFPLPPLNTSGGIPRTSAVVSSRNKQQLLADYNFNEKRTFEVYTSLPEAIENAPVSAKKIVLAGGTGIYAEGMQFLDELVVSRLWQSFDGDVRFPNHNKVMNLVQKKHMNIGTEYEGRHTIEMYLRK